MLVTFMKTLKLVIQCEGDLGSSHPGYDDLCPRIPFHRLCSCFLDQSACAKRNYLLANIRQKISTTFVKNMKDKTKKTRQMLETNDMEMVSRAVDKTKADKNQ